MTASKRILSWFCAFAIVFGLISDISVAHANFLNIADYGLETISAWLSGSSSEPLGGWTLSGALDSFLTVNRPQKYYTQPTSSVEDKHGNVTNYYRGGDTTDIKIVDSYNKTFNTIHNTTNNTNNYKANIRLSDFLNNYTTNNITSTTNNKYTYSADFKSWYYDNTTNNYNYTTFEKNDYTQNNLYYNQDNSRYYISIDNSTDEYYLVDVQYSPTFVIPALGSGHAWTETSRTETEVHYTCSTCGETKTEPINAPSDLTMSSLMEKITAVFSTALDWTGTVAATIAANPMLLLCVVLGFIGTGVLLFKRFLRL